MVVDPAGNDPTEFGEQYYRTQHAGIRPGVASRVSQDRARRLTSYPKALRFSNNERLWKPEGLAPKAPVRNPALA